jgi:hypothetical protein
MLLNVPIKPSSLSVANVNVKEMNISWTPYIYFILRKFYNKVLYGTSCRSRTPSQIVIFRWFKAIYITKTRFLKFVHYHVSSEFFFSTDIPTKITRAFPPAKSAILHVQLLYKLLN